MQFAVLSSGSKANCTVVTDGVDAFLIDCGLSARETNKRLVQVGVDPCLLRAVILTHEHRDHTVGIKVFCKKLQLPVYTNAETAATLDMFGTLEGISTKIFKTGYAFNIGSFEINPFAISHDAAAPVGYEILHNQQKLVYVTDLGKVTTLVKDTCRGANGLIIESNHDEQMLWNCDYPWQLKQRIASNHGHLSNVNSANLVKDIFHPNLQHVILAHISENSNTWDTAKKTLENCVDTSLLTTCLCATPYEPTPLITITVTSQTTEDLEYLVSNE